MDYLKNKFHFSIITKGIGLCICIIAIIFCVTELVKLSTEDKTPSEKEIDLSKILIGEPYDPKKLDEYKLLSGIFGTEENVHARIVMKFQVSTPETQKEEDEEENEEPNAFWLCGEIWNDVKNGLYQNKATVSVFGYEEEIGSFYEASTNTHAEYDGNAYVAVEGYEPISSRVNFLTEEEAVYFAEHGNVVGSSEEKQIVTQMSLSDLMSFTGGKDFSFAFDDVTDLRLPVILTFDDQGRFQSIKTIQDTDFSISEGNVLGFSLSYEYLGTIGDFVFAKVSKESLFEEDVKLDVLENLSAIQATTDIDPEDYLITKIYGEYPEEMPKGMDFAQRFVDAPKVSEGIWNIAAYVAYHESQESFEKWYVSKDTWELNNQDAKKACILLWQLGVVNDFTENVPEEELTELLQ